MSCVPYRAVISKSTCLQRQDRLASIALLPLNHRRKGLHQTASLEGCRDCRIGQAVREEVASAHIAAITPDPVPPEDPDITAPSVRGDRFARRRGTIKPPTKPE